MSWPLWLWRGTFASSHAEHAFPQTLLCTEHKHCRSISMHIVRALESVMYDVIVRTSTQQFTAAAAASCVNVERRRRQTTRLSGPASRSVHMATHMLRAQCETRASGAIRVKSTRFSGWLCSSALIQCSRCVGACCAVHYANTRTVLCELRKSMFRTQLDQTHIRKHTGE